MIAVPPLCCIRSVCSACFVIEETTPQLELSISLTSGTSQIRLYHQYRNNLGKNQR